jgi:hypothetical protein
MVPGPSHFLRLGPWSHSYFSGWSLVPVQYLDALVPGPNQNLINGPGPRCNGPWSLGPFDSWSLVPGPSFRVSAINDGFPI